MLANFQEVNMCRASIYEARNNFSNLVKIAEGGEPVELTRYDKPVAVLISYEDYENRTEKSNFLEKMKALKEKYKDVLDDEGIPLRKEKIYLDPNRVIFEE